MNPDAAELLPVATGGRTRSFVLGLLRPHRGLAVVTATTLVAATAAGLSVPAVVGRLIDEVRSGRGPDAVTGPALVLVVAAFTQAVLAAVGSALVARLGETALATLRERVVHRALALPSDRLERAGSGDLVARVSADVAVVAGAVRSAVPELLQAGLTVVLTVAALGLLDWRFALATLAAAPIQVMAVRWYLRSSTPVFVDQRVAESARTQQLLDSFGGADTVRAFRLDRAHTTAVRDSSRSAMRLSLHANRLSTRFFGRLNAAEYTGLALVLLTGFWLVRSGTASVGTAAAAALYFHRLFDPVNALLALFATTQQAAAGLARLVGVAELAEPPPAAPALAAAPTAATVVPTGDDVLIDVRQACFRYDTHSPVLRDVTLGVAPGEHVAVVGASGAGKSTLAKLIAGIHEPTSGSVGLHPSLAPRGGRREVTLVTQEVHVFAGTIVDNLVVGADVGHRVATADLERVLELVGARAWVEALPDGIDTVVGEGGHVLSAERAQQLALARLALADPAVAVLDEATADAGSAGARVLDRAAAAALRNRTAVVVAHRLTQAAAADRVVVLEDGRVVQEGPHDELLTTDGAYARLWTAWAGHRP